MYHIVADDGRILTSPQELKPQLNASFQAFIKVLGHIRFFYVADEKWDGKTSLVFCAADEPLMSITLCDSVFNLHIANQNIQITDETDLDNVFEIVKINIHKDLHRPVEQLSANPDPTIFACGYRCDLCLGSKQCDEKNYSHNENFGYMNWLCYHNCVPGHNIERWDGIFVCSGCNKKNNKFCLSYSCSKEKGFINCAECGEYHSCDVYRDCHYAGQCNLGITAEEITNLVIPYCMKERLDFLRYSAR